MNIRDIISLAVYNLWRRKKTSILIGISFFVMFLLFLSGYAYTNSLNRELNDMLTKQISLSSLDYSIEVDALSDIVNTSFEEVTERPFTVYSSANFVDIYSQQNEEFAISSDISQYVLKINDKNYIGENDNSYTFPYENNDGLWEDVMGEDLTVQIGVDHVAQQKSPLWTQNELKEFHSKYPNESILLYGHEIQAPDEIVISDYLLDKFHVPSHMLPDLIGESISLLYMDDTQNQVTVLDDVVISGIISQNFFRVETRRQSNQVIASYDYKPYSDFLKKNPVVLHYDAKSYEEIPALAQKISEGRTGEVYFNEYVIKVYSELSYQKQIMEFIFILLGALLFFAFIVNIMIISFFQFRQKGYYYGVLSAIGMPSKKILLLHFFEFEFLSIIALIMSIPATLLLMKGLNAYLYSILFFSINHSIDQFVLPCAVLLIFSVMISIILSLVSWHRIQSANTMRLLAMD